MPIDLDGDILKRTMADIESPSGHADPKIPPPDVSGTSRSVNGAEITDAAGSHPKGSMTTAPSLQADGNTSSNTVNESPKKIVAPIVAAAADREIAHQVWMNSSERDDEVRDALGRMVGWFDEFVSLLHTTLTAKAELETTLTVTQSNLALALSNTEMLEEALKRDASGRRADVGWARSSASVSYSSPATAPLPANPNAGSASNAPMVKSETGFFKFLRNSTGARTPPPGPHHLHRDSAGSAGTHTPHSSLDGPSASTPDLLKHQSHLMSPSMPSLHATNSGAVNALSTSRREEELVQALQRERASTKKVLEEKRNLEEELESLSQALFEEANRMVSTERRQRAQVEEELQNVRQEREALKGALRIVEGENSSLRSEAQGVSAAGRVHRVSSSDASSSSRDRRALTIDTDRASVQGEGAQESWIDLTQTPPKSEVPQLRGHTPTPAVNTKPNAVIKGRSWDVSETGSALPQSRKGTSESNGSRAKGYDHLPRGTLSFGM